VADRVSGCSGDIDGGSCGRSDVGCGVEASGRKWNGDTYFFQNFPKGLHTFQSLMVFLQTSRLSFSLQDLTLDK